MRRIAPLGLTLATLLAAGAPGGGAAASELGLPLWRAAPSSVAPISAAPISAATSPDRELSLRDAVRRRVGGTLALDRLANASAHAMARSPLLARFEVYRFDAAPGSAADAERDDLAVGLADWWPGDRNARFSMGVEARDEEPGGERFVAIARIALPFGARLGRETKMSDARSRRAAAGPGSPPPRHIALEAIDLPINAPVAAAPRR